MCVKNVSVSAETPRCTAAIAAALGAAGAGSIMNEEVLAALVGAADTQ